MRIVAIAKMVVTFALFGLDQASAQMSISEVSALRECLVRSWPLPKNVTAKSDIKLTLRILLKQDGTLAEPPQVIEASSSPLGPALAESARRAVRACEPFKMLKPEHYESWKSLDINFNPRDLH